MSPFRKKAENVELSTTKLLPGVVKIFGDYVSPGSNYKCVRVDHSSTAQQVLCIALQKFNLEDQNPKDYVLCDVIGTLSSQDIEGTDSNTPAADDSGVQSNSDVTETSHK